MAVLMKSFKYVAVNEAGKTVKGTVEGTSKTMVTRMLEMQNLSVSSTEEYSNLFTRLNNMSLGRSIKPDQLLFYLKQLGALLTSGVKLVEALEILAGQTKNKNQRKIYFVVQQEVYNGNKLSAAFEMFPSDFPPVLIAMTQAGEATGDLGETLLKTADHMERQGGLNKKIKKAITKPLSMLLLALVVAVAMTLFVFPTFMSMFEEMDAGELPIFTKIFIHFLAFLKSPFGWGSGVLIVVGTVLFMFAMKKSFTFKDKITRLILKIPGFGTLMKMNNQILLASTLSSLMSKGVAATDALLVTKKVTQNTVFVKMVDDAYNNVVQGKGFAKAFVESKNIDPIMARMIETGEKTSEIPKLLGNLVGYYNQTAEIKVNQVQKTIQPVIMLFVYAVVMCLLLAIMMPQLTMATNV